MGVVHSDIEARHIAAHYCARERDGEVPQFETFGPEDFTVANSAKRRMFGGVAHSFIVALKICICCNYGDAMSDKGTSIVTGANSGIGLATVLELARRGFRSVGTVRSDVKAKIVHDAASAAGVQVHTAVLDVTDASGCEKVIAEFEPSALVNNAGYSITGAIEDVTDEEARHAFETMVLAPMRLARLAIPMMRERGGGRIVNVSSIYGRAATPLTGWYQGAKHALEGLSDALRMEVARDNVKVVLVEPGGFKTGIWEETQREIAKRAGSRFDANYERTLRTTGLMHPIMGDPVTCARVIGNALTTSRPRARYLVGYDAHVLALWSSLTPTEVKDRIVRLTLGL